MPLRQKLARRSENVGRHGTCQCHQGKKIAGLHQNDEVRPLRLRNLRVCHVDYATLGQARGAYRLRQGRSNVNANVFDLAQSRLNPRHYCRLYHAPQGDRLNGLEKALRLHQPSLRRLNTTVSGTLTALI